MKMIIRFYYFLRHKISLALFRDEARQFSFSVGSAVRMQNAGFIQLENKCVIMRKDWQDQFSIEEMEVFKKDLID